jgi:ArsR family transcriptional regulator, virulence genes transcriptional regulator
MKPSMQLTNATSDMEFLKRKAAEAAVLLGSMANAKRLMVLCSLIECERSVGELAQIVGLSSAALSQHLAKMRALNLVATRREAQTIYYSLASDEVREILQTLYRIYCVPQS